MFYLNKSYESLILEVLTILEVFLLSFHMKCFFVDLHSVIFDVLSSLP